MKTMMKARNVKPDTVRIQRSLYMRISQGLLGPLAGSRQIRFRPRIEGTKLILDYGITGWGYPGRYSSDIGKSPLLYLRGWMKLQVLPPNFKWLGEYPARKNGAGEIVVDLASPLNGGSRE